MVRQERLTTHLEVCAVPQAGQVLQLVVPQVELLQMEEVPKLFRQAHKLVVGGVKTTQRWGCRGVPDILTTHAATRDITF